MATPPSPAAKVERAIAKIAARQHGVFSREQALAAGATPRIIQYRIGTGRWARIFPGVYKLFGVPATWHQSLMAACLAASQAVTSHRSAARLLGLHGFESEDAIELTMPRGQRRLRSLIVHETNCLLSRDVAVKDRIRVTTLRGQSLILLPSYRKRRSN